MSSLAGSPAAPATSTAAGTSTTSAPDAQYTDYNSCMRAYVRLHRCELTLTWPAESPPQNKCLDAHQPKNGGAADFSSCQSSFNCKSYQRMAKRSVRHAARH